MSLLLSVLPVCFSNLLLLILLAFGSRCSPLFPVDAILVLVVVGARSRRRRVLLAAGICLLLLPMSASRRRVLLAAGVHLFLLPRRCALGRRALLAAGISLLLLPSCEIERRVLLAAGIFLLLPVPELDSCPQYVLDASFLGQYKTTQKETWRKRRTRAPPRRGLHGDERWSLLAGRRTCRPARRDQHAVRTHARATATATATAQDRSSNARDGRRRSRRRRRARARWGWEGGSIGAAHPFLSILLLLLLLALILSFHRYSLPHPYHFLAPPVLPPQVDDDYSNWFANLGWGEAERGGGRGGGGENPKPQTPTTPPSTTPRLAGDFSLSLFFLVTRHMARMKRTAFFLLVFLLTRESGKPKYRPAYRAWPPLPLCSPRSHKDSILKLYPFCHVVFLIVLKMMVKMLYGFCPVWFKIYLKFSNFKFMVK